MMLSILLFICWHSIIQAHHPDSTVFSDFLFQTHTVDTVCTNMGTMYDRVAAGHLGQEYAHFQPLTKQLMSTPELERNVKRFTDQHNQCDASSLLFLAHLVRFGKLRILHDQYGCFQFTNHKTATPILFDGNNFLTEQDFDFWANIFMQKNAIFMQQAQMNQVRVVVTNNGLFDKDTWVTAWVHRYTLLSLPADMGLLTDFAADEDLYHGVFQVAWAHDISCHEKDIATWDKGLANGLGPIFAPLWTSMKKTDLGYEPMTLVFFAIAHENIKQDQVQEPHAISQHVQNLVPHYAQQCNFLESTVGFAPRQNIETTDILSCLCKEIFALDQNNGSYRLLKKESHPTKEDIIAVLQYWYQLWIEDFINHIFASEYNRKKHTCPAINAAISLLDPADDGPCPKYAPLV